MSNNKISGIVILAGAGPGDPDLITLKLQDKLKMADVIIVDRLVNPVIIQQNARKEALIVQVGKQGYNDASILQKDITDLIIHHALSGKMVLRLKGGDVAFFSNVLDELIALKKFNIPFEIIPGITAASGASAYAGIPLTARGISQGVLFKQFSPGNSFTPEEWNHLATTTDTLVFYMASRNILELVTGLLLYAKKSIRPIAVIGQATTIHQQIYISTLKDAFADFVGKEFGSPSLVIIGEVVHLHTHFNWFATQKPGSVFNELIKQSIPQ